MKHFIKVRIKTKDKSKVLLKLNNINITMKDIEYQNDYLVFIIPYEDLKRIKKYLISINIEVVDDTGIYKIKKEIRKNLLFIISIIFSICLFLVLSNVIIKVNVVHENSNIRELLLDALKERGVENLTFKKSYQEYEDIIEDIKNLYQDEIEWLEIDIDGMIMNVRVEERIKTEETEEDTSCHIVASKPGMITSILTKKGVAEVKINDYVNKGDILINGMVKLNDEVKNNVCANGEVYAEVWYTVSASIPLEYENTEKTGKMRYNFIWKNGLDETKILKSRVKNAIEEKKKIFGFGSFEFDLVKEYETKKVSGTYTEEEAINKAYEVIHEKLETKGIEIDNIINEKVLKKSVNNGNLDIDMFISVKEQIGVKVHYDIETESDTNVEEYNGDNN